MIELRAASATPDPHDDGEALLVLAEGSGSRARALEALGVTPEALRDGDRAGAVPLVTRTARGGT